MLGFKIAGVKVKFPVHFIDESSSVTTEIATSLYDEAKATLKVLGVFLAGSYIMKRLNDWQESKRIAEWNRNVLIDLKNKHEDTLLLIKDKAARNQ